MNKSQANNSTNRTASLLLLALLAVGSLTIIWWYRPSNRENRYNRMTRVELEQLLERDGSNALAWRVFALKMAKDGAAGTAEPALIKAHQLNPSDPEIATGLGELWLSAGRIAEAFQLLKQTAETSGTYAPPHRALGRLYMRKASYQHALDEFNTVVRLEPKADDAWYEIAVSCLQMQKAADAETAIEKALSISPNAPPYLALQGSILVALGRVDEGLTRRIQAAKAAPGDIKIQSGLVNLLLEQHRNEADIAAAEEAISRIEQVSTDYPLLPYQRGKVEMLRQHWPAAERFLRRALETTPQQDEIYFALSQTEQRLGHKPDADKLMQVYQNRTDVHRKIDAARATLADNPRDITAFMKMADLYMRLGDRNSAIAAINGGLEIDPKHPILNRWLQTLQTFPSPAK
jgi:tetratricopeptide (TPR) repeat protein